MTATIDDVRQELVSIAKWAPKLPASWSDMPMRASRMGDGVHVRMSHAPLPGGMERLIDDWQAHGVLGIHTQIGVQQALGPWADELRTMREMLIGADPRTGTITYLTDHLDWARTHMDHAQWQYMSADIHGVWERVQHLVCPDVERAGTCPGCGSRIEWVIGSEGRVNMPICPNPKCKVDLRAGLIHAQRARIKHADPSNDAPAYADIKRIKLIWPNVKESRLRKWVQRGKIRKEGDQYCVTDIAARLADGDSQEVA